MYTNCQFRKNGRKIQHFFLFLNLDEVFSNQEKKMITTILKVFEILKGFVKLANYRSLSRIQNMMIPNIK